MKIGIIGAGNLGKSIIDSLLRNNITPSVSNKVEREYKGIRISADNKEVVMNSDVILLAVKPQAMDNVLNEIRNEKKSKLIISFAAGLKLAYYEERINARIVRVMTNLAVKHGKGISMYKMGNSCKREDKDTTEKVLGYLGKCLEVKEESLIDIFTGISGSGIAYLIKIISVFVKSARKYGIDKELSEEISYETVRGALSLMENSNWEADEIISRIASKGGTTEQGLKEMEEKGLADILESTVSKTIEKCKGMGDKK